MEFAGIASVAAITVCCYLIGEAVKQLPGLSRWIPVICGVCGAVLGVLGMMTMAEFPAEDHITAVAVGIVSGLAATGADQIKKQMKQ